MDLQQHLAGLEKRFDQLVIELSEPNVTADPKRYQDLRREQSRLSPLIDKAKRYRHLLNEQAELTSLAQGSDAEMKALAEDDLRVNRDQTKALEEELQT